MFTFYAFSDSKYNVAIGLVKYLQISNSKLHIVLHFLLQKNQDLNNIAHTIDKNTNIKSSKQVFTYFNVLRIIVNRNCQYIFNKNIENLKFLLTYSQDCNNYLLIKNRGDAQCLAYFSIFVEQIMN